ANVTQWKRGDRAGVGWHGGHCFVCNACRKGLFLNCERAQVTGISFDGGYAEYVVVPHEAAARIPEKLDAKDAAPLLCAGITTYNALRNSGARPGTPWPSRGSAASDTSPSSSPRKWVSGRSGSRVAPTRGSSRSSSARTSTST